MEQMNKDMYIALLIQTLEKKAEILGQIQDITKKQESILASLKFEEEAFNQTLIEKESLINQINQMDDGFAKIFERVKELLNKDSENYQTQIKKMQELISKVTEMGVALQAAEQKNKMKLESVFMTKRKEIKQFKQSSATAMKYYKVMSNQNGDSVFYDKKK